MDVQVRNCFSYFCFPDFSFFFLLSPFDLPSSYVISDNFTFGDYSGLNSKINDNVKQKCISNFYLLDHYESVTIFSEHLRSYMFSGKNNKLLFISHSLPG